MRDKYDVSPQPPHCLFALAACTQDELADDNRLSEGEYPVAIRATRIVRRDNAAGSPFHPCYCGRRLGRASLPWHSKMGDAVKEYTVTASTDFKSATLSRENDPYYWTSRAPDYRIGMVALRQCRHHTDACREGGRRPEQIG